MHKKLKIAHNLPLERGILYFLGAAAQGKLRGTVYTVNGIKIAGKKKYHDPKEAILQISVLK